MLWEGCKVLPELSLAKRRTELRKRVPLLGVSLGLALLAGNTAFPGHGPTPNQVELASISQTLAGTQADLVAAQEGLLATGAELASTRDMLEATQAELASVRAALASATAQVGRGNPTYSEAVQFLREDQTDRHKYDFDSYNCRDFSADVLRNADSRGIRAAFISIRLRQGSHAVVGFETVDKGMVYFEPQTDKEVVLPLYQSYLQANGYKPREGRDDTITRVTVIW